MCQSSKVTACYWEDPELKGTTGCNVFSRGDVGARDIAAYVTSWQANTNNSSEQAM